MPRWTPEENQFLMEHAYRAKWDDIARTVGRSIGACQAQFRKIAGLQKSTGRWKGIGK
jgi:hypothetical protein